MGIKKERRRGIRYQRREEVRRKGFSVMCVHGVIKYVMGVP